MNVLSILRAVSEARPESWPRALVGLAFVGLVLAGMVAWLVMTGDRRRS